MTSAHRVMTVRCHKAARNRYGHAPTGLTILEVLVCVVIALLVGALILAAVRKVRHVQSNVTCLSNLQSISGAFRAYAVDHQGRFPDPGMVDKSWEKILKESYYDGTFRCSADSELAPVLGSSYDWRDTGLPSTTLAGRTLADVRRPNAVMVLEAMPGWHHQDMINVVRIDGSSASIPAEECFGDLATAIRPGNPEMEKRNANIGR